MKGLALVLAVSLALTAAGCADATQSKPQKIGADDVPFGLLAPPTSTVAPTTVPRRQYPFVVYFINPDGAVPVVRTSNERPVPTVVGDALLAGPTPQEVQVRMHSAIPKQSVARFSGVLKQIVTVDLHPTFTDVNLTTQRAALTQIVFTLTALPGVKRVRFLLDGEITSVPRLNGTTTRGTVGRADYTPERS